MDIQVISFGKNNKMYKDTEIVSTTFSSPRALDEFDFNIIDLTAPEIWKNKGNNTNSIDIINDFISIEEMVLNKRKSTVIYILPQNEAFKYNYTYAGSGYNDYVNSKKLKDMLDNLCNNILSQIVQTDYSSKYLLYEHTKTEIGNRNYEADFYFQYNFNREITKSYKSDKTTTVLLFNNVYITTLNVNTSDESLMNYINTVFLDNNKESAPEWFQTIKMFDDDYQLGLIDEKKAAIKDAELIIIEAENKLSQNNRYESILYTNGEELVSVVFDILEQILECDLSHFKDESKEDFLVEVGERIFIGEIKGVTSNVKNEHITQVEVHYQGYCDMYEDETITDKVKPILIINPLRSKKPEERDPVHEKQIQLAKRNGCLIIETKTLLKLYERFTNHLIESKDCIELLYNQKGILTLE